MGHAISKLIRGTVDGYLGQSKVPRFWYLSLVWGSPLLTKGLNACSKEIGLINESPDKQIHWQNRKKKLYMRSSKSKWEGVALVY